MANQFNWDETAIASGEPCQVKHLPASEAITAARVAGQLNPANLPLLGGLAIGFEPLPPEHLALLTSRYWGSKGVHLTVQFFDTSDASLKARVLSHMNAWGSFANVKFDLTNRQGMVRIARTPGDGYWSYLGTDILHVSVDQPTMNLEGFTANTSEAEFRRVVRHETGHTLGFVHEHLRREIVGRIDQRKALAYFSQTQGWTEQMVYEQVLRPLEDRLLTVNAAEQTSVMTYWFPASITVDGKAIIGGKDITDHDMELAARLYPKRGGARSAERN